MYCPCGRSVLTFCVVLCAILGTQLSLNDPVVAEKLERVPDSRVASEAGASDRLTVRRMRIDEFDDVRDFAVDAFAGRAEIRTLLEELRFSWAWDPQLSLVADLDGAIVGQVLYTKAFVDAPERLINVLVLSPVAARPDLQRQAIGTSADDRQLASVS